MGSGRSPLLLPLFWAAFALWSPLLSVSGILDPDFITYSKQCGKKPRERFFYNVASNSCEKFLFSGCSKALGTYGSMKECLQSCSEIDFCDLPPEMGTCYYKTLRWFYDPKTQDCKIFTFGGCGGNLNNFDGHLACWLRCHYGGGYNTESSAGSNLLDKRRKRTMDLRGRRSKLFAKKNLCYTPRLEPP